MLNARKTSLAMLAEIARQNAKANKPKGFLRWFPWFGFIIPRPW